MFKSTNLHESLKIIRVLLFPAPTSPGPGNEQSHTHSISSVLEVASPFPTLVFHCLLEHFGKGSRRRDICVPRVRVHKEQRVKRSHASSSLSPIHHQQCKIAMAAPTPYTYIQCP